MSDAASHALAAARSLRASPGYAHLPAEERAALERDLARIEHALTGSGGDYYGSPTTAVRDPYAVVLETPADLRGSLSGSPAPTQTQTPAAAPAPASAPAPQRAGTEVIGGRARQALEAVDFPSFVAELITGTFQAIVDATTQQIREYGKLVSSIAQSVDSFSRSNVTPNQVRDWFAGKYPEDLMVVLPKTGEKGQPQLRPRRKDESPSWLAQFGLAGKDLTPELAEGPLLEAGRNALGEERLQTLATMVLMGINRIVVSDGQIRARLQFHASASESVKAEIVAQSGSQNQSAIAARATQAQTAVSMMVSTASVNAQADVAVKANLLGEVVVKFRSETFNLERFADSQAIELINRHSRTKSSEAAPPAQHELTPGAPS